MAGDGGVGVDDVDEVVYEVLGTAPRRAGCGGWRFFLLSLTFDCEPIMFYSCSAATPRSLQHSALPTRRRRARSSTMVLEQLAPTRNALCLSGQLRSLADVLSCDPAPSCWHAHVLPALGPHVDFFVSTTEDLAVDRRAMRRLLHNATHVTRFSPSENLTSWYARHGDAAELESMLRGPGGWLKRHTNLLGGLGASLKDPGRHARWGSGALQARHWYGCQRMIQQAEQEFGALYSFVAVGRPDLVWHAAMVPLALLDSRGARCYVPQFDEMNGTKAVLDDFAICTRAGAAAYLNATPYYNTAAWRLGMRLEVVTQAEEFLAWRLGRAQVELQRLPPIAFVSCECKIMNKTANKCLERKTNMWSKSCIYDPKLNSTLGATYATLQGAREFLAGNLTLVRERGWHSSMIGVPARSFYGPTSLT